MSSLDEILGYDLSQTSQNEPDYIDTELAQFFEENGAPNESEPSNDTEVTSTYSNPPETTDTQISRDYSNPPASDQPAPVPESVTQNDILDQLFNEVDSFLTNQTVNSEEKSNSPNSPASVESNSLPRVSEPAIQNDILGQLVNEVDSFLANQTVNAEETFDSNEPTDESSSDESYLEAAEQKLNQILESPGKNCV